MIYKTPVLSETKTIESSEIIPERPMYKNLYQKQKRTKQNREQSANHQGLETPSYKRAQKTWGSTTVIRACFLSIGVTGLCHICS